MINDLIVSVEKEMQAQTNLLRKLENECAILPEGSLYVKQIKGKAYLYFYSDCCAKGKNKNDDNRSIQGRTVLPRQKCLSAKGREFGEALQRKRFLKKCLPLFQNNIRAMERFLNDCKIIEPFDRNEMYPDGLIHRTLGGRIVRSKSEMIIAGILEANDVPFRYEAALNLGNHTYYPDFTILTPGSGELLFWEHFGMMSDEEYEFSAYKKMYII